MPYYEKIINLGVIIMEEKMNGLDEMVEKVGAYCNDNGIEYIFAAVAEGGKYTKLAHNTIANTILKESSKVMRTLIGK